MCLKSLQNKKFLGLVLQSPNRGGPHFLLFSFGYQTWVCDKNVVNPHLCLINTVIVHIELMAPINNIKCISHWFDTNALLSLRKNIAHEMWEKAQSVIKPILAQGVKSFMSGSAGILLFVCLFCCCSLFLFSDIRLIWLYNHTFPFELVHNYNLNADGHMYLPIILRNNYLTIRLKNSKQSGRTI